MKPLCLLISALLSVASATAAESTLPAPSLLNGNAILDAYGRGDNDWFLANIPFFDCPDKDLTDIYYYRWWNYRKNIVWNAKSKGWTIHEGGGYDITPCPLGHQLYEGRWLKDRAYITDYIDFWLTGGKDRPRGKEHPRNYANWLADGCYARFLVDYDAAAVTAHLGHLTANYEGWEQERFDAAKGLFKWVPDRDGMEASLAGFEQGEGDQFKWNTVIFGGEGYRPSFNSYLYADARAIAGIADLARDQATATAYRAKAKALKANVLTKLWDADKQFFLQRSSRDDRFVSGREQIGFFPWAFHLPDDTKPFAQAWKQLRDPQGFEAKYGPTTLERRSPYFLRPFGHACLWNGPSWPFSTSVTLAALANLLNDYHQDIVTKADYLALLQQYAATQHDPDGQPMVREDHHPDEKRWLAQGAHYNHSRYCDLIITGLVGLRPRSDNTLEINPLAPAAWDFFCLENVAYHGRLITIVYDRTGTKYGKGAGLRVLIDGVERARAGKIGKMQVPISSRVPPPLPPSQAPAAAQVEQGNLALNHAGTGFPEPSASFTCPADNVWQALDGQVGAEPRNRWTCYGTKESSDWLAIDLGTEQTIDRAVLHFYDDGAGVRVPQSWTLQYWKDATWVDCPGVQKKSAGITELVTFPPLLGRKFRAVFTHQKGSASGVIEFGLYAPAPPIPVGGPAGVPVRINNGFFSAPAGVSFVVDDQAAFVFDVGRGPGAKVPFIGTTWVESGSRPSMAAPDDGIHKLILNTPESNLQWDWGRVGGAMVGRLRSDKPTTATIKFISKTWPEFPAVTYRIDTQGASGAVALKKQGTKVAWRFASSLAPIAHGDDTMQLAVTPDQPGYVVAGFGALPEFTAVDGLLAEAEKAYTQRRPSAAGPWGDFVGAISDNMNNTRIYSADNQRLTYTVSRQWINGPNGAPYFGWDTFFNGLLGCLDDPQTAKETIRASLAFQTKDGYISNAAHWGWESIRDRSQPPVGALCVWKMHQRNPDLTFLREVYPNLVRWHAWWLKARDGNKDGLLEWGSGPIQLNKGNEMQGPLWECGWDDTLAFEGAKMVGDNMNANAVDLNSLYSMDAEYLGLIAKAIGMNKDAEKYHAEHLSMNQRINEKLWNKELGIYCNRLWDEDGKPGAFLTRMTPMNFYPLICGAPDAAQARRVLKVMTDPKKFWGQWLLPTLAYDDPEWKTQHYWRGAAWGPVNYLLAEGLKRYGTPEQRRELVSKSVDLFMRNWTESGMCGENFNSGTGKVQDQKNYTWGALLCLIGVEATVDVTNDGKIVPGQGLPDGVQLRNIPIGGQFYDAVARDGKVQVTRSPRR